jgi:hypothetical protein
MYSIGGLVGQWEFLADRVTCRASASEGWEGKAPRLTAHASASISTGSRAVGAALS